MRMYDLIMKKKHGFGRRLYKRRDSGLSDVCVFNGGLLLRNGRKRDAFADDGNGGERGDVRFVGNSRKDRR